MRDAEMERTSPPKRVRLVNVDGVHAVEREGPVMLDEGTEERGA
jgi:hypothetical protein